MSKLRPEIYPLAERRWGAAGTPSPKRLAAAFAVAAVSDVLSYFFSFALPLQWCIDLITSSLLFFLLGYRWALLPGLIAEAIPGLGIFPFWLLVVGSIAAWGRIRRPESRKEHQF